MPTVIGQIGGIQLYAWVFSAYLLTNTVSVPIYGKLADLYGRKPVFLVATAIFLISSMLCGQSQTMEQLILFRLLQGLGGGGMLPITQTILGDVYTVEERARIGGLFSTIWGISGLLGPAIGGFFTEHVSWRWVFYVNSPLCVLAMLLVWRFLHEQVEHKRHRIDLFGAATLSAVVVLLLVGLQARAPLLYLAAAALVPVFVWQERRAAEPLVPLHLFAQRAIGMSTLGGLLLGCLLFSQSTFVPPFVQAAMGATPTISGFVLAGASVGWPLASTAGGPLLLRWGYRRVCLIGAVLTSIGFVLLWRMPAEASLLVPAAIQCVIGAGFGFSSIVLMIAAQNAVGWQQRGVVTSAHQFARSIGGTIGVSIAGAIFSAGVISVAGAGVNPNDLLAAESRARLPLAELLVLEQALVGALRSVYAVLVGVALLGVVVAALLPGGRPDANPPDLRSRSPSDGEVDTARSRRRPARAW